LDGDGPAWLVNCQKKKFANRKRAHEGWRSENRLSTIYASPALSPDQTHNTAPWEPIDTRETAKEHNLLVQELLEFPSGMSLPELGSVSGSAAVTGEFHDLEQLSFNNTDQHIQ
jgi:hypothetical protein